MKLTIGHLFFDLLNLYGESGNILALKHALEAQQIEVELKNFSLDNESWNLSNIDIFYIGAGTEQNILIALETLKKYKDELNQMLVDNKFIIATGNAIELFGKTINNGENIIETLSLIDFETTKTDKRIVSECVFNYDKTDSKILGFENHQGKITGIKAPLFTVEKGFGSDLNSKKEGIRKNNFFGTYLLGPILARNPELLENLCHEIILTKDPNYKLKDFDFTLEKKAHANFLKKYLDK